LTYTRIRRLGSGEFGDVYLEMDNAIGRLCASKVMSNFLVTAENLVDEAALMHLSRHPQVAEVYSAEIEDGVPVVRMEYLAAGSVESLSGGAPLGIATVIQLMSDAARGLHHLHSLGVVHRDVKASNLLLTDAQRVKVADFGLATRLGENGAFSIAYVPHLAPEEIGLELQGSPLADQYALGVTAYRLLNGDNIFWGGFDQSRIAQPALSRWLPHIHPQLQRVVRKATNRDPRRRYDSIADFRFALERVMPAVSWEVAAIESGMEWVGSHAGTKEWRIALRHLEKWEITLYKTGRTGRETRVLSESRSFETTADAYEHCRQILSRLAVSGRL
jgi:eukaryotic-like serine/threonine-protein kinase